VSVTKFSILALKLFTAFRDTFDGLDAVNYVAVAVLDFGIFALYYIFEWYHKRKSRKTDEPDLEMEIQSAAFDGATYDTATTL
jgi:hypothetical protein